MGRHEPPTDRSFYLSVAASTLRFALIIVLAVAGIVVIDQAFPEISTSEGSGGGTIPSGGGVVDESPSPSVSTTPTESPAANIPSPTVQGTRIAVFNGTNETGLAGTFLDSLVVDGYIAAQEAADAPTTVPVTTLYYQHKADQVEAEYIANTYFKKLPDVVIAQLGNQPETDIAEGTQVAIFLGNDYAALRSG